MGLLTLGTPLSWQETQQRVEHVRRHGLAQFVNLYRQTKGRKDAEFRFGDEIEYQLVHFDAASRKVRLYLHAGRVLDLLQEPERRAPDPAALDTLWRPEYAAYMVEGTPGRPYSECLRSSACVERNMRLRRQEVSNVLPPGCAVLTLTTFPRLGCVDFCSPFAQCTPNDPDSPARSLFFPDAAIFDHHPRFASLTRNVRERRGEKVTINCPIYHDSKTPWPFSEAFSCTDAAQNGHSTEQECNEAWTQQEHCGASRTNQVYLDAMGFGMGMCCLQVTFQAADVHSARLLYDQLVPVGPLMLAVTAATPVVRGFLLDTDVRWYMISASVDDRTPAERGCCGLSCEGHEPQAPRIPKSRYDSVDMYLSTAGERYNDVPVVFNDRDLQQLLQGDVDQLLAKHVAHLFVRDTISLFAERVEQNDETETDHFENIQSTNWQSLRFKPPPSGATDAKIGWRVEFRTMEVQPSDMANAAFTTFIMLLARAIKHFSLNLCLPMSFVEENMKRAQSVDACRKQRFYWRKNIFPQGFSLSDDLPNSGCDRRYEMNDDEASVEQLTIREIFEGCGDFCGLIPVVHKYLRVAVAHDCADNHRGQMDVANGCLVDQTASETSVFNVLCSQVDFIAKRVSGQLPTFAQSLRRFIHLHPEYKQDSLISDSIAYDICLLALAIARDEISESEVTENYDFFAKLQSFSP